MSNFSFVPLSEIRDLALAAEKATIVDPRSSCISARIALESTLQWMFDNDKELIHPYESNLNAYLKDASFKLITPPHILSSCELIRKAGNQAAHEAKAIQTLSSRYAIMELHKVLFWFTRTYFNSNLQAEFNPKLLSTGTSHDTGKEEAQKLAEQLSKTLEDERNQRSSIETELAELRAQIAVHKASAQTRVDNHDYSEAETRKHFIDLLLLEAGWKVDSDHVKIEYELSGVKRNATRSGHGCADYVLFGDDGNPLAIVEAKKTSVDAIEGKYQAEDYADALEAKFGHRPLIFYTNGYEIYFWDDKYYPPRKVAGFFKKEEISLAIQRRSTRKPLKQAQINEDIAGRPYQILAIRAICAHFEERHRRSLVVMATGTGKTRTAIALVELLQKANWAKRILFLCDRDSLLIQTKRAFTKNLPNTPAVDLRTTRSDTNARVCLSTYATMMNLVDEVFNGVRPFSPAHFDLIIIDEAHRSIYQKYQALFTYFDGLLVGLTATPRTEVDRNTYQMFELVEGNPTYAFELEEAVAKEYLVSYEALSIGTGFTRKGIKYANLTNEEKEEYEKHFSDSETGALPNEIQSAALNRWLFNKPTVESFIMNLMEHGIKVEGGDKIGKTIIFALNIRHAQFIVECFDAAFPKLAGKLCARIDYSLVNDAQQLIDKFSDPKLFPQIAVSVDMLDTGIDVPEVVNLVFAKPVYSQVKFWQMLGRGTRLCPNLFGPGTKDNPKFDDKTKFLIMDYCGNLEYFSANPSGKITRTPESMTTKLFKAAITLSRKLDGKLGGDYTHIGQKHLKFCRDFVNNLNESSFIIRPHLRHVEKFKKPESWVRLGEDSVAELMTFIAPLPSEIELGEEDARRWDLLLLRTELALIDGTKAFLSCQGNIQAAVRDLAGRPSIPEVKNVLPLIEAVCTEEYWVDINLDMLEEIREKLRNLIQYIELTARKLVYSNFADQIEDITPVVPLKSGLDLSQYKKRMDKLLTENLSHIAINKIRHLIPLTETDLAELDRLLFEGKEDEREVFIRLYGDKSRVQLEIENPPVSLLIRSIVGLDRSDVEKKLAEFINRTNFNPRQLAFIDKLVDFFVQDGYVSVGALYEPPFDQFHHGGPDELFGKSSDKLFEFVEITNSLATLYESRVG